MIFNTTLLPRIDMFFLTALMLIHNNNLKTTEKMFIIHMEQHRLMRLQPHHNIFRYLALNLK